MPGTYQYADSRLVSRLSSARADPDQVMRTEIGPAWEAYRRRWEAARTFQEQPPFPLHLDLELKFSCNLRCPMCLMSLPPDQRQAYGRVEQELSLAMVRRLLDEGREEGLCALGFGGLWEPLLSPDLPEIVGLARDRGLVDVMFNTNGLLLDEKTGLALIQAGLTRLMISLDAATPETYARMRVGSDFERVTANIENFLALRHRLGRRLPLVRLSFCRTAVNEHELEAFQARWREAVDFFSIQAYGRYPGAAPPNFPTGGEIGPPTGRCAQPHKRLLVRHDGRVLPCCDASGLELNMGDVAHQSLGEIWRGEPLAALRCQLAAGDLSGPAAPCRICQAKFLAGTETS